MDQAHKKCANIKEVYEACYRKWYSEKFLSGNIEGGCQDEFDEYKDCVTSAIRSQAQLKGVKLMRGEEEKK